MIWAVVVILVYFFQCRPIEHNWDPAIKGTCIDISLFRIISAALDVFTNLILLGMPLPALWKLHMTTAQKCALAVTYILGLL